MKKFGKWAVALLVAASLVVVTGCDPKKKKGEESVLYKSAKGDTISGKKIFDDYTDYFDVTITILKPDGSNEIFATARQSLLCDEFGNASSDYIPISGRTSHLGVGYTKYEDKFNVRVYNESDYVFHINGIDFIRQ